MSRCYRPPFERTEAERRADCKALNWWVVERRANGRWIALWLGAPEREARAYFEDCRNYGRAVYADDAMRLVDPSGNVVDMYERHAPDAKETP